MHRLLTAAAPRHRARALGTRVSVVVAHGFSCPTACEIFPDQGLNPRPLHWQADSQPLDHYENPLCFCFCVWFCCCPSWSFHFRSDKIRSVAQSCPTLCDPMNRSTPGLPVHHQLPEFTETHVHRVGDVIQPSHPLSSPSLPAPNPLFSVVSLLPLINTFWACTVSQVFY